MHISNILCELKFDEFMSFLLFFALLHILWVSITFKSGMSFPKLFLYFFELIHKLFFCNIHYYHYVVFIISISLNLFSNILMSEAIFFFGSILREDNFLVDCFAFELLLFIYPLTYWREETIFIQSASSGISREI